MIEFDEKRKLFTVNWFRFLNFDAIKWEFSKKKGQIFKKITRGRQIFKINHQLMIEFDEKRKLFTVSRRLVVVYSKVVYMREDEILGPATRSN